MKHVVNEGGDHVWPFFDVMIPKRLLKVLLNPKKKNILLALPPSAGVYLNPLNYLKIRCTMENRIERL